MGFYSKTARKKYPTFSRTSIFASKKSARQLERVMSEDASLSVCTYAGYSSVSDPREKGRAKGGGKRGAITGFSRQSQLRLIKKLMALSQTPRHFVTLTYPAQYPADPDEWYRHLENFLRLLDYHFPDNWFYWKKEPQKRGAPHFHLIGDLGVNMNEAGIYRLLRVMWWQVVGATGENGRKHFYQGTQVRNIEEDGHKKTSNYVSKYVGKTQVTEDLPEWARPGRFWGVHNKKNVPAFQWEEVRLSLDFAVWLKRLVRRWMKRRSRRYSRRLSTQYSYSLFSHPELMRKILFWILGPYQLERWRSDQDYGDVYFYDPENGSVADFAPF
jgi:hypothetical protein